MMSVSLHDVLQVFGSVSEEQAWALGHQLLISSRRVGGGRDGSLHSVYIQADGSVQLTDTHTGPGDGSKHNTISNIARLIYAALDYGISEDKSRVLTDDLEEMIDVATRESEDVGDGKENSSATIQDIITLCEQHYTDHITATSADTVSAAQYYTHVCTELVTDHTHLSQFIHHITSHKDEYSEDESIRLFTDDDNVTDMSRVWLGVMKELRVKCSDECRNHLRPVTSEVSEVTSEVSEVTSEVSEVSGSGSEVTPYEMLLQDIRDRNYSLTPTAAQTLEHGAAGRRKDAHELLLEYVRSRPALRPVPVTQPPGTGDNPGHIRYSRSPRECLMDEIKCYRLSALRLTPHSRHTRGHTNPPPVAVCDISSDTNSSRRRVIKARLVFTDNNSPIANTSGMDAVVSPDQASTIRNNASPTPDSNTTACTLDECSPAPQGSGDHIHHHLRKIKLSPCLLAPLSPVTAEREDDLCTSDLFSTRRGGFTTEEGDSFSAEHESLVTDECRHIRRVILRHKNSHHSGQIIATQEDGVQCDGDGGTERYCHICNMTLLVNSSDSHRNGPNTACESCNALLNELKWMKTRCSEWSDNESQY